MFMYLAYQNVHQPQQVPAKYENQYESIENEQRRILAGQVSVLDEAISNVTEALKEAGMWDNTIFIFSSDNGGNSQALGGVGCNYPLRGNKGTLFEGGIRVAGFVSGPLVEKQEERNKEWIHISDWYPTILGLAGVSTANLTLDGYDQWAAITGTGHSPRKELLHNYDPLMPSYGFRRRNSPFDNRQQAALRVGDYKIITGVPLADGWYKPVTSKYVLQETSSYDEAVDRISSLNDGSFLQNIFLFNITADPYERNDLSEERPEVVDVMLSKLAEYAQGAVPPLNPANQLKEADPSKHADDLGFADIGYNGGGGQIKTPVLDKLASEGVTLDNYYVQPLCTPSRSALLAGKWHLGMYKKEYLPVNRGFDTFYGYYHGMEDYFSHRRCAQPFPQSYCGLDLHNGTTKDIGKNNTYSAHVFTEEAMRLIQLQSKKSSPMFMYLAYQNVHQPQQVPAQYENQYEAIENEQRRILAGQVSVLDEAISNVTEALKEAGMWDNTIFIFSSDNGGNTQAMGGVGCNYPLRGNKGTLFEGGVRVAGFVSGPLVEKQEERNKEWIHISDWYPTILGLAGVSTANLTLDGYDQWAAITGTGHSPRKELLHNYDPLMPSYGFKRKNSPFDNRLQAALRVGDYKIVTGAPLAGGWYTPNSFVDVVQETSSYDEAVDRISSLNDGSFLQNIFLFNITADPYERNDLSEERPEVVGVMLSKLAEYAQGAVPPLHPANQLKEADPSKHGDSWEPWQ
ncbi:arylsulfatase B-like [Watersipora subatra]|uniref:arylsulfatase B-like n=1 Tax=Watersipora subatra TaxID=2589382 RepID=UPI00355C635D